MLLLLGFSMDCIFFVIFSLNRNNMNENNFVIDIKYNVGKEDLKKVEADE